VWASVERTKNQGWRNDESFGPPFRRLPLSSVFAASASRHESCPETQSQIRPHASDLQSVESWDTTLAVQRATPPSTADRARIAQPHRIIRRARLGGLHHDYRLERVAA
jgi:hypothetical protein